MGLLSCAPTRPGVVRSSVPLWFAGAGLGALVVATLLRPAAARAAAAQNWSPFVLVTGLLLVGLVADDDGVFARAGHRMSRLPGGGVALFCVAAALIGLVTALLNLDTSVAFLTPVLVATARSRDADDAPFLYGSLLLANAGSLFLPGANLTNLIVLGHVPMSGAAFLAHLWAPALAALVVTAAVVGVAERRALRTATAGPVADPPPVRGLGAAAVVVTTVLVVVLRSPALAILLVGAVAVGVRMAQGRHRPGQVTGQLGLPVLVGLFGVSVALGTLGRVWSGPEALLLHLGPAGTAVVAAAASVLVNNLPAASLLAARVPPHPLALLVGLDLGPNLAVTGSLAWVLWLRAARTAGARPSVARAARLGLVAVPLSMAAALACLAVTGAR
jgi:arsenical pump membrane protein